MFSQMTFFVACVHIHTPERKFKEKQMNLLRDIEQFQQSIPVLICIDEDKASDRYIENAPVDINIHLQWAFQVSRWKIDDKQGLIVIRTEQQVIFSKHPRGTAGTPQSNSRDRLK